MQLPWLTGNPEWYILSQNFSLQQRAVGSRWPLPCSWSAADQMTHGGNTMLTQTCNAVEKILFSNCLFTQELGTTLAPLFWLGIHWLLPETLTATRVTALAMLKNKHTLQNPVYNWLGCWITLPCCEFKERMKLGKGPGVQNIWATSFLLSYPPVNTFI